MNESTGSRSLHRLAQSQESSRGAAKKLDGTGRTDTMLVIKVKGSVLEL